MAFRVRPHPKVYLFKVLGIYYERVGKTIILVFLEPIISSWVFKRPKRANRVRGGTLGAEPSCIKLWGVPHPAHFHGVAPSEIGLKPISETGVIHAPPCSCYSVFYCSCYQMKSPSYGLCCVIHPQVLTKDSVTVAVDAVVYFRIYNATMSITNVENANRSTRLLAQTTLRNVLGTKNLSEILGDRETISETMQVNKLSLYPQISIP